MFKQSQIKKYLKTKTSIFSRSLVWQTVKESNIFKVLFTMVIDKYVFLTFIAVKN